MRWSVLCFALLGPALLGAVAPRTVMAHDVHPFGQYTVAVGWLHEPAYVGTDNAVQVLVKDQQQNPVTDITDKDLTVDVSIGSQTLAGKQLVPTADPDTGLGIPGEYEFHVTPTVPGSYTFHIKGAIKGVAVDESVAASDKTFDAVTDSTAAEFPAKVPAGADLARRVGAVSTRVDDSAAAAHDARDAANRALVVGIIGIVVAVLLGATAIAIALRSRGVARTR